MKEIVEDLIDQIYREDADAVSKILKKKVDLSLIVSNDVFPLFAASGKSTAQIVDLLLRQGADVNQVNTRGRSSLMEACSWAMYENVEKLVAAGANVNYCQNRVTTALSTAVSGKEKIRLKIIDLLIKFGADLHHVAISKQGTQTSDILCDAAVLGSPEIVKHLINLGAKINVSYRFGTPLIQSIIEKRFDIAKVLLELGADPKIRAPINELNPQISGLSALDIAKNSKNKTLRAMFGLK